MPTCFLLFCFKCGVVYLKIQFSLVPVLNCVLGFSGSLVSVSVIMSVHLAARCIENNIQMPVFVPDLCVCVSSSLIVGASPSVPHLLLYSGVKSTELFSLTSHSFVQLLQRVGMALRGRCGDLQFSHEIFIDANGYHARSSSAKIRARLSSFFLYCQFMPVCLNPLCDEWNGLRLQLSGDHLGCR